MTHIKSDHQGAISFLFFFLFFFKILHFEISHVVHLYFQLMCRTKISNLSLDSFQAPTLFRQISFSAICHSRQQLHSHPPRSRDCRERGSHVTMSSCLLPSGDTVKCRLRVISVAKQPYSNFV